MFIRKEKQLCLLFIVYSAVLNNADALRILGIFPYQGKSHFDVFEPLLHRLANKGHDLTVVSNFSPTPLPKGWKQINIPGYDTKSTNVINLDIFEMEFFGLERFIHLRDTFYFFSRSEDNCRTLTTMPEIVEMVRNQEQFDVIIIEHFNSDCAMGLAYILNAPVVGIQTNIMMPWSFDRFGQPQNPAYVPCLLVEYGPHMTFLERVENTIFHVYYKYLFSYWVWGNDKRILETNLNVTLPPMEEVSRNMSLLLTNTYHILNGVKPLVPGVVEVGGIHIKNRDISMPQDLEKFMNSSDHGVILFSMGSMIKATTFPIAKRDAFMEVFSELKQKVIWKWEGEPFEGLPDNVYIMKWLPQYEILHHPKTVAFVSHGGLLGMTEAVHAGVPMLVVPVYGDQHVNAAAAQQAGLGVKLPYTAITQETVAEAMKAVLSNKMRESAKSLSEEWLDRPSPLKLAVDKVEYIARHGGKRIRSPSLDLMLHQELLLDVLLFVIVVLLVMCFIAYRFLCFALSAFCRTTKAPQLPKKDYFAHSKFKEQ